tara:strand:- start:675 stop:947 length:273 start_codon:yes stop_codon:yes gene_type:complete
VLRTPKIYGDIFPWHRRRIDFIYYRREPVEPICLFEFDTTPIGFEFSEDDARGFVGINEDKVWEPGWVPSGVVVVEYQPATEGGKVDDRS